METYYTVIEYCKNLEGRIYHRTMTYANGNVIKFKTRGEANCEGANSVELPSNNVIDFSVQTHYPMKTSITY